MFSDRLNSFIEHLDTSHYAFEMSIGVSKGAIRKPIVNKKTVGVDIMEKIISVYPELNIDWLVTGRGGMLLENIIIPSQQNENRGTIKGNDQGNISKSKKILPYLGQFQLNEPHSQYQLAQHNKSDIEVEKLQAEVLALSDRLKEKDELILALKERVNELKEHIATLKEAKLPAQVSVLAATKP